MLLDVGALPVLADISVGFTMIHDKIPSANNGFVSFVDGAYVGVATTDNPSGDGGS